MSRILVADDSSTVRNVVAHSFRGTDVEVLEAASGEEALELARRQRPDLVLCDVLMMGISGYEVAEALAEERVPVLLLTGPFEPFDEERARRAGAAGVLAKPFEPRHLVERVREILAGGDGAPSPAPAPRTAPEEPPPPGEVLPPLPPPPAAPRTDGDPLPLEETASPPGRPPGPPARVPLPGDADFTLGGPPAAGEPVPPGIPPDPLRAEARRVLSELAPGIVREVAWEVVPDLLERLLRETPAARSRPPRSPGDEDR